MVVCVDFFRGTAWWRVLISSLVLSVGTVDTLLNCIDDSGGIRMGDYVLLLNTKDDGWYPQPDEDGAFPKLDKNNRYVYSAILLNVFLNALQIIPSSAFSDSCRVSYVEIHTQAGQKETCFFFFW